MTHNATQSATSGYLAARLNALGIPVQDAHLHGLHDDGHGNVEQVIRTFAGFPILWQDRRGNNAARIQTLSNRKTGTERGDLEQFNRPLSIVRISPENLERLRRAKPDAPKYRYPSKEITGHGVYPMPTNTAIDAFTAGKIGGVAVGVEGYFKACALALNGAEATAFTGISTYKVDAAMAEYLIARRLDDFIILYDADARHLPDKNADVVDSTRLFSFYASARNFAEQFYTLTKKHGLKTRLHMAVVSENAGAKGVDDVLEGYALDDRRAIVAALQSLTPSPWFDVFRLPVSKFKPVLDAFFGVKNHVEFYNRYRHIIRERPFRFAGATYQLTIPAGSFNLFNREQAATAFTILENPFDVPVNAHTIQVNRYLAEATRQLDGVILANNRVCIDAPTGTGKNAFFLGYKSGGRKHAGYFARTKTRGIITVPTRILAQQLEAKFKIPALYGEVTRAKLERILNAPVAVCTYDTLRHISDLPGRVLVVDEAHNLINQYGDIRGNKPFRAETLRRMVERFDVAQKTVMISGTPPRQLAHHFGFYYLEVQRRENNRVNVHALEASTAGAKGLTTALLAELHKVDFSAPQIHFAYYNNREQLHLIAEHLNAAGKLPLSEIAIITRETVDGGHKIFNEVVQSEQITGAKLVLSTCLLAEGINLNNRNTGRIFTVGIDCPDSFRQYVARFRNMPELHVYDIRPPEQKLGNDFSTPATAELSAVLKIADGQKELIENSARYHAQDFPVDSLEFWDDIQPQYRYRPDVFTWIYQNDAGKPAVDVLRILASIRERMMDTANNAFFYAQIGRHPNIIIQGMAATPEQNRADIEQAVNETAATVRAAKDETLTRLKNDLAEKPAAVVGAYHARVKKAGNRHARTRLEVMAPDLICDDVAAAIYLEAHADDFRHDWFTAMINRFIRVRFTGVNAEIILEALDMPEREFWRMYSKWKTSVEFMAYENRAHRCGLTAHHKAEIKTRILMREWIKDAAALDGIIQATAVVKLLNDKLKRRTISAALDGVEETPLTVIDAAAADRIIHALFDVEETRYASGTEYLIKEMAAPWITSRFTANPLQILSIY